MTRNLKIESDGDFFHGKVVPKIRLKGKWLERAAFPPGSRVVVTEITPGILMLEARTTASAESAIIAQDDESMENAQRAASI